MYRQIEEKLYAWKNRKHKPLILSGARQTGKTYTVQKFSKCYPHSIYINFERDLQLKQDLSSTAIPQQIIEILQLSFPQINFADNDLLIIFDEVQACPQILTSIKFLSQETTYDYILTGSLLGIALTHTNSYPVGYVESMQMFPMNFKEFLLAIGIQNNQIQNLKDHFLSGEPLLEAIHQKFLEYFRLYMIIGGMPECIQTYIRTQNILETRKIQKLILEGYYRDMAKYAIASDRIKVHDCFSSIPNQLSKENKKFQYKLVQSGGNARIFESSLQWLKDCGIVLPCYRVKSIDYPLNAYKEISIFKIYMFDTGLLTSLFDEATTSKLLMNDLGVYKGAIYENIAAQTLYENHHELFYFEPSTRSEIDFLITESNNILPIEIKSSSNTQSKSLNAYINKYNPKKAYRFSTKNIHIENNIYYYPIYMLMFI